MATEEAERRPINFHTDNRDNNQPYSPIQPPPSTRMKGKWMVFLIYCDFLCKIVLVLMGIYLAWYWRIHFLWKILIYIVLIALLLVKVITPILFASPLIPVMHGKSSFKCYSLSGISMP